MSLNKLFNILTYCLIAGLIVFITARLIYDAYQKESLKQSVTTVGYQEIFWSKRFS